MDNQEPEIESPLRDALRRGRSLPVPGFTERALQAIRRDTRRRRVIRWTALSAPLAGCAAALIVLLGVPDPGQTPSELDLAQLASLHDEVTVATPQLDDADALAALILADS
ncbi:MAG: hypothetical protein ACO23N_05220 [Opitutales bacterium]